MRTDWRKANLGPPMFTPSAIQRFHISTSEQSGARREKTRSAALLVQHLSSFGQTSLPILSSFSFSVFLKPLFPLVCRGFFSLPADFHSLLRRRFDIQITFGSINSEKKTIRKKKRPKRKTLPSFSSDGTNSIRSSVAARRQGSCWEHKASPFPRRAEYRSGCNLGACDWGESQVARLLRPFIGVNEFRNEFFIRPPLNLLICRLQLPAGDGGASAACCLGG